MNLHPAAPLERELALLEIYERYHLTSARHHQVFWSLINHAMLLKNDTGSPRKNCRSRASLKPFCTDSPVRRSGRHRGFERGIAPHDRVRSKANSCRSCVQYDPRPPRFAAHRPAAIFPLSPGSRWSAAVVSAPPQPPGSHQRSSDGSFEEVIGNITAVLASSLWSQ